jgi:hypothetical protein
MVLGILGAITPSPPALELPLAACHYADGTPYKLCVDSSIQEDCTVCLL